MDFVERAGRAAEWQPVTIATAGDEQVCEPCREREGKTWRQGDPIEHPACENPNGCRCLVAVEQAAKMLDAVAAALTPVMGRRMAHVAVGRPLPATSLQCSACGAIGEWVRERWTNATTKAVLCDGCAPQPPAGTGREGT